MSAARPVVDVNRFAFMRPFMAGHLLIPRPLQRILGIPVGLVLHRVMARSREGVEANLRRVLGDGAPDHRIRALAWRTFYKYGLYLLDYMSFSMGPAASARELIGSREGTDELRSRLAAGRGAIVVTPHLGHWELGGAVLAFEGHAIHVLTGRTGDGALEAYRARMRRRLGIEFLVVDGASGAAAGLVDVARALSRGGLVAMLADRAPGVRSVPVEFFGARVPFPAGPAALALATEAPVFPAAVTLDRDFRYRVAVDRAIEVSRAEGRSGREPAIAAATQAIARSFEKMIRRDPDQWYNFFPFFEAASRSDDPRRRSSEPRGDAAATGGAS